MRTDGRLLALSVAAGIAVAVVVTLLQDSTYRADASIVLARQGQPPGSDPELADAADAAAELFHSRAVADSAVANLRLDESPETLLDRVEVTADADSSLVRVEAEGTSPAEARRTVQEVVEIATVLYNDRFGPQTVATIWETPRAEDERVSPDPLLNVLLGALAGGLLGRGLQGRFPGRLRTRAPHVRRRVAPSEQPAPFAQPSPQPDPKLVVTEPEADVASPRAAETEPVAAPVPPPEGTWSLQRVEWLVATFGDRHPEQLEEWQDYLLALREIAEPDGTLPIGARLLVEDLYRDLEWDASGRARAGTERR